MNKQNKKIQQNKLIGAHVSCAGGIEHAPLNALAIQADSFAIFTKNQRQWQAKELSTESIAKFKHNLALAKINAKNILVHDSYLINLGSPDEEKLKQSLQAFIDEAIRVQQLGASLLNFHPGSHLNQMSEEDCLKTIAKSLNQAMISTEETIFVIENTAGQGSNVGYRFEHLSSIIDQIANKKRIGICLDTCHLYSSGYDWTSSKKQYQKVMDEFDSVVGFNYLRGVHLNDSKVPLNKRVDRHEHIGKGYIGLKPFQWLMSDPRFNDIPMILETPDPNRWSEEIKLLKSMIR